MTKPELAFSLNSKVVEKYSIDVEALNVRLNEKFTDLSINLRIRENLDSEVFEEIVASIEKEGSVTKDTIYNVIEEIKKST